LPYKAYLFSEKGKSHPPACNISMPSVRKAALAMFFARIPMDILHCMHQQDKITWKTLERLDFENVKPLCKDLPANPCREIVAGGLLPAVKGQSQAQNALRIC
jgi:hypothetical protein